MTTNDHDQLTADRATANLATALRWLGDALAVLDDQLPRLEATAHALRAARRQCTDPAVALDHYARRLEAVAAELRGEP
ncbi:hypothetical protein [Nocardia sp. NPDC004711]